MEIYWVTGILLIIWIGIFFYTKSLDSKVKQIEKQISEKKELKP